jgi:hypothetical protein
MPHRIFSTSFASVYPLNVQKAERKGRTQRVGWVERSDTHRLPPKGPDGYRLRLNPSYDCFR